MNLRSFLRTLAFASVCALPLPAGVVTINFTETGGNVVVTLSGSLTGKNLAGGNMWTQYNTSALVQSNVDSRGGTIAFDGTANGYFTSASNNTGNWTVGFGTGPVGGLSASSSSGDVFAYSKQGTIDLLLLPVSYSFSTPTNLSSTMTFTGKTFAALGITPGTYEAIYGQDKIQLTFGSGGASSVPDAGPGPALALLLGGFGLRQWHSSRRSRAAA